MDFFWGEGEKSSHTHTHTHIQSGDPDGKTSQQKVPNAGEEGNHTKRSPAPEPPGQPTALRHTKGMANEERDLFFEDFPTQLCIIPTPNPTPKILSEKCSLAPPFDCFLYHFSVKMLEITGIKNKKRKTPGPKPGAMFSTHIQLKKRRFDALLLKAFIIIKSIHFLKLKNPGDLMKPAFYYLFSVISVFLPGGTWG